MTTQVEADERGGEWQQQQHHYPDGEFGRVSVDGIDVAEASSDALALDDGMDIASSRIPFLVVWRRRLLIFAAAAFVIVAIIVAISVSAANNKRNDDKSGAPSGSDSGNPSQQQQARDWTALGDPIATTPLPENEFIAIRLALSDNGTIVAIGNRHAPYVRVYQWQKQNWTQMGANLTGKNDSFGADLALSGDGLTIAIGGPAQSTVRVFRFANEAWGVVGRDIRGAAKEGEQAGTAVAVSVDGTIVAVGAHLNSDAFQRSGQVRVYQLVGENTDWVQIGQDINGEAEGDQFGEALSLSSDGLTLAVGARFHNGDEASDVNIGHVRVFRFVGDEWILIGGDIEGNEANEQFGYSVALSGDATTCAIGNTNSEITVYRQKDSTEEWSSVGESIPTAFGQEAFAYVSLSRDGNVLAVLEQSPTNDEQHNVVVFGYDKRDSLWAQIGSELVGAGLALSGDGLVVAVGGDGGEDLDYVRILTAKRL